MEHDIVTTQSTRPDQNDRPESIAKCVMTDDLHVVHLQVLIFDPFSSIKRHTMQAHSRGVDAKRKAQPSTFQSEAFGSETLYKKRDLCHGLRPFCASWVMASESASERA